MFKEFVAAVFLIGTVAFAYAGEPRACIKDDSSKTCAAAAATLRALQDPEAEDETHYPDVDCASALPVYANLYVCSRLINCKKFGTEEYADLLVMNDTAIVAAVDAAATKDFTNPRVSKEWIEGRKAANIASVKGAQKLIAELKVKQISKMKGGRVCQASAKFNAEALKALAFGWAVTTVRRSTHPETWTETAAQAEPIAEKYSRCLSPVNTFTVQNAVVSIPKALFVNGCN